MSEEELRALIARGEGQRAEFKAAEADAALKVGPAGEARVHRGVDAVVDLRLVAEGLLVAHERADLAEP